jgi:hypothetical protein
MQNFYKNIKSLYIALLLVMGGCASVMMGSYQDIFIETKCGEKPVKAECSVSNEIGVWSVKTPGSIHLHKGYDELELNCKGESFDLHKVYINSSGNLPLYGNALVGGGIGAFTDIETRAGFDYPTKITFIVKSCNAVQDTREEVSKNKSTSKESEGEPAKSYPVTRGVTPSESPAKSIPSGRSAQEANNSLPSKAAEEQDTERPKRETAKAKPAPTPYCKQLDMAIPGCTLQ